MTIRTWYVGKNNYKKLTLESISENENLFTMEFLDVDCENFPNGIDALASNIPDIKKSAEVLYSGGLDSEATIVSCLKHNIPVIAVTMKLMYKGSPFNTHDLYYAEKFCREHNVRQVFYELDVENFFTNGDHVPYMEPYGITYTMVPTHMWLIQQCHNFPIIGGDYSWPQTEINKPQYSPHRHEFAFYDIFMREQGIPGIGNMLSHSLESNLFFIKEHIKLVSENPFDMGGDNLRIKNLKHQMLYNLGFGRLELRHKSHGWENITMLKDWFDGVKIKKDMEELCGTTASIIKWNTSMGRMLGVEPGKNDNFGI
jgi:hypothetical protein